MDENLRGTGDEDRSVRPLGLGLDSEEVAVERLGCGHVGREERDFDDLSHVAISNSRKTSLRDVFRSVEALRSPTISAQGSS